MKDAFESINLDRLKELEDEIAEYERRINKILEKRFRRNDIYADFTSGGVYVVFKDSRTPLSKFLELTSAPNFDPWSLTH